MLCIFLLYWSKQNTLRKQYFYRTFPLTNKGIAHVLKQIHAKHCDDKIFFSKILKGLKGAHKLVSSKVKGARYFFYTPTPFYLYNRVGQILRYCLPLSSLGTYLTKRARQVQMWTKRKIPAATLHPVVSSIPRKLYFRRSRITEGHNCVSMTLLSKRSASSRAITGMRI